MDNDFIIGKKYEKIQAIINIKMIKLKNWHTKGKGQDGRILIIILVIIAIILVLSYLNFDIEKFINSPSTQKNIHYVTDSVVYVWDHYLKGPAIAVYDFFIKYIWDPMIAGLERMKNGDPAFDIKDKVPKVTPPMN